MLSANDARVISENNFPKIIAAVELTISTAAQQGDRSVSIELSPAAAEKVKQTLEEQGFRCAVSQSRRYLVVSW